MFTDRAGRIAPVRRRLTRRAVRWATEQVSRLERAVASGSAAPSKPGGTGSSLGAAPAFFYRNRPPVKAPEPPSGKCHTRLIR